MARQAGPTRRSARGTSTPATWCNRLYVGGRYNTASGDLVFGSGAAAQTPNVGADRVEIGGGWFITRNIMLKGDYVTQKYNDFPTTDICNGGKVNGFMFEGMVAF